MNATYTLNNCRFEPLSEGEVFRGLGRIWIGDTLVRSGRLPLCVSSQGFGGQELAALQLCGVEENEGEIRIRCTAQFRPLLTKLMRDHSFDPIHETGDWDEEKVTATGSLDLVLRPSSDSFNGVVFSGFSYHWEYSGEDVPLFYLLDRASWELDGDINGATAISQSSCSAPVARFDEDTEWSTEGIIHFDAAAAKQNPVMTHNLPRWASHGSFDFQYKGGSTLLGVFERVDLIRSLLKREAGKAELKCFDKHIFDQTTEYSTVPKKILLSTGTRTETDQQNLWTWVMDEVHERARAEFGLREEPLQPRVGQNYWVDFTIEKYYEDLLPAAQNIGARSVFVDNLNKSDMTEKPEDRNYTGNMCCGHEYEPAPELGGVPALKRFIEECRRHEIQVFSWTNNDQSYRSPLNNSERDEKGWYVKMEDARLKYGGAYTNVFNIWSYRNKDARQNWVHSLKKIKAETGLNAYLFDSFYNLGFMPVDYSNVRPRTMWRELLGAFKELQDAGVHFMIESFGPFGEVQHGCPKSYNHENLFACYKIGMGTGYTTVPTGADTGIKQADDATKFYYVLAHMTRPGMPLFINGERIDHLFSPQHKRALADYYENQPHMHRRYLQEDGQGVLWHDKDGTLATLWNFADREVALPGSVCDATTGEELSCAGGYSLLACHTYTITSAELPRQISS